MVGPLGGALAGLAAATTILKENVDGGPPGGAISGSSSSHHCCWRIHRWLHLAPFKGPDSIFCLNAY
jgi:hypothetical protein